MTNSKAQIIATFGPASADPATLRTMIGHQMDIVRLNFSWGDLSERAGQIGLVRELEKGSGRRIPVIIDLPGPRIQGSDGHTYDREAASSVTSHDEEFIKFAAEHGADYIAVSFVSGPGDVEKCREVINGAGGKQKIIAKIERAAALDHLEEIIAKADAVMVARGDLGKEVPLEQIPFIQDRIIKMAKKAGKPVIVATDMLLSMVENPAPTRAEVTDVANAIIQGADAVMLSEETAKGRHPVEAVAMMEKIVLEAERHMGGKEKMNPL